MNLLNLSKEESLNLLDLRKEQLNMLCLEKPILINKPTRVAVVMDYSGSMENLYRNGTVQAVLERLLPIAMKFDDNGEMELWIFSNDCRRMENITLKNYYGYVQKYILNSNYWMGGTEYAPVMQDVVRKYITEEPAALPNYVIFITDGENSDRDKATAQIIQSSYYPIFWQFVGIGNASFRFLKTLDDMDGRYVDNANFFELNDILRVSDEELYRRVLAEYPTWLEYPEVQKLIENPGSYPAPSRFGGSSAPGKKSFFQKLFGG